MRNIEYLKDKKVIKLCPYVIVGETELDRAFDHAYDEGKEDFRGSVIKVLESILKDETLKILLVQKIKNLNSHEY